MKKTILTLTLTTCLASLIFISCNSSADKLENEKQNVIKATQELDEANAVYLADVEKYKAETNEKIAANNQSIIDFNLRIEKEKKEVKADYKKKIAELEQKNSDMKKRIDDYKSEGKEKWDAFKTEFSRDMEELGTALKNLTTKND